ncbi:MAG: hypothetical protein U9N87_01920 [Planctomycetota bacterium]|nr:hypothetical protein [Planctomycetota bacterium]
MWYTKSVLLSVVCAVLLLSASGCGDGKLPLGKVEGKVLYKGQPLKFGAVLFQPLEGPPAKGRIQSDGTFVLGTYTDSDGAVLGRHQVQVRCFTSQDPNAPPANANTEASLGKSLIPIKYVRYQTSGLREEVAENNEPVVIELK